MTPDELTALMLPHVQTICQRHHVDQARAMALSDAAMHLLATLDIPMQEHAAYHRACAEFLETAAALMLAEMLTGDRTQVH